MDSRWEKGNSGFRRGSQKKREGEILRRKDKKLGDIYIDNVKKN